MTSTLRKNVFRDITKTKARFISIMLIVALGVGFFTGIKATAPSMDASAEEYYIENCLMDIRLLSTVGFGEKDVEEIRALPHVRTATASYYTDVIINSEGDGSVIRLYSDIKENEDGYTLNKPILHEGRLPEKKGEITLESSTFGNGGYALGDTLTIQPKAGDNEVGDILESMEFTIVGFAQTPLYISFDRGNTDIGNGKINLYGIICEDDFKYDRYTQVYVLTDYSDGSIPTLDENFDSLIDSLETQFTDLGAERAVYFDSEYLSDARKKLEDAKEDFRKEKEKAEKEIADAEKKLNDGEKEFNDKISEAKESLDNAKKQIDDGEKQLEQGWKDYYKGIEDAQTQLDNARAQLQTAKADLKTAREEFNSKIAQAQRELNAAEREYNSGLDEYNRGLAEFNAQTLPAKAGLELLKLEYENELNKFENFTKPDCERIIGECSSVIENAQAEIESYKSELEQTDSVIRRSFLRLEISSRETLIDTTQRTLERYQKRLDDAQKEVDSKKEAYDDAKRQYEEETAEPKAKLDEAKAQLDAAKEQIDNGKAELAQQKAAGEQALSDAQTQITQAQTALTQGQTELAAKKNEGWQQLKDSEKQLSDAKELYEEGKTEFEKQKADGEQKLKDARSEFEEKKTEAQEDLNDAQAKLDKAEEKLNDMENPEWYFFTRRDNPGYTSLIDDTTRVDAVGAVFPLFFMLVAALVCLTTLTRHVEEKRTEIGTLKALGYTTKAIMSQFLFYSTAASLAGCVLGIGFGMMILPRVIYNAYGIMYMLIDLKLKVPVLPISAGVVTAFVCTTLVSLYTCMRVLREKPSELMRPKAPKIGRRILLERMPFIWNRMNFTSKVTARNIVRYKARFFMTVIGVAGCTALILTGFGLKNSISSIADKHFGEIYTYDMIAVLEEEGTAHEYAQLLSDIEQNDDIDAAMLQRQVSIGVKSENGKEMNDDIYMIVPQSAERMENLIHLRQRKDGAKIELTDEGAVVTEKMADKLGITIGSTITITEDNKKHDVKVTGISENYIFGYVFITPQCYKEIYGRDVLYNMMLCGMKDANTQSENRLGAYCLDKDGIVAVSFISGSINSFLDTISSLDLVILVLLVCAGLLAIVVLYNLTNINIEERVREIATIKVLGFYNGETCAFVYRENIILTLCGIIAGLGIGVVLHRFVILTIEINKTMFSRDIAWWSYLLAAVLTAVFAAVVNFIMYFKIKKINMVESLKSIE